MKQWTPKVIPFTAPRQKLAWEPSFKTEAGTLYVKIGPGLINNFLPTNFQQWFTLPKTGKMYFNLQINSSLTGTTFNLTSVTIEIGTNPPETIKAVKNGPPSSLKLCLGVFDEGTYHMFYNQNINIVPNEVLKTEKAQGPANIGGDPFDRWFSWVIF